MNFTKAVLLDRDGTVIVEPADEHVDTVAKIKLFPDTLEALSLFARHGFGVIIITNQVAVADGRITMAEFDELNNIVLERLAPSSATILKTYMCPHYAADNCDCRKPKPTLLLQAIKEFNLDPAATYMVGDRRTDILAGINAGLKTVLVQTALTPTQAEEADYTAPHLLDAAKYIVTARSGDGRPQK